MSTVPECLVAVHAGMQVLAFSIVTDMCLPDALEPADIARIIAVAQEGGQKLEQLLVHLFHDHAALLHRRVEDV
jgi:purine-nucleoside phosphorylase